MRNIVHCMLLFTLILTGCSGGGGGGGGGGGSSNGISNITPIANAGVDQNVAKSAIVHLDGSVSSDSNGDALSYKWSIISKPTSSAAVLSSAKIATPTFTADREGTYTVQLVVNDGTTNSVAASVTINASNTTPLANAGVNQSVAKSTLIHLDGRDSSDANGDTLTYLWSFSGKPVSSAAILSSATTATLTFTADKEGTYTVQLVVNDGTSDSVPASVAITATNTTPIANAGKNQTVVKKTTVNLDGRGSSDANGDGLSYNWSITGKPASSAAVLSSATIATPSFFPDMAGVYTVQLVVNDGTIDSVPASVAITATNTTPIANAGKNQTVVKKTTVNLDGRGSSDANGDTLTYLWSFAGKPANSAAVISSATIATPSFFPDMAGVYTVQLVVNDGTIDSVPANVTITATNTAPVANAGKNQTVPLPASGAVVTLSGNSSYDGDGDDLTYSWKVTDRPAGSTTILSLSNSVSPILVPDIAGPYTLQLVVNDGTIDSLADTVVVYAFTATGVLPDTGQTTSYTDTYGEDADYTSTPSSYNLNGDGITTDNLSGLMWQSSDDNKTYNWYEATGTVHATLNPSGTKNVCGSLRLGGYSNWRVPTIGELLLLTNLGLSYPVMDQTFFPGVDSDLWSSTSHARDITFAWAFSAYYGVDTALYGDKSSKHNVLCVREMH